MRAFFPYFAAQRLRLAALAAAMAAATFAEGAGIGLFYPLAEFIVRGPAFLADGPLSPLSDVVRRAGLEPTPGLLIGAIFVVLAVSLSLKFAVFTLSAGIYNLAMRDIRVEAFRRILSSHLLRFHATSSSTAVQTLENEVEHVGQSFNFLVVMAASAGSVCVYAAISTAISAELTLLVACVAALRYGVSSLFIPRMRSLGAYHATLRQRLKSAVIAVHQGIDVIKSFGTEDRERARFESLASEIRSTDDSIARTAASNTLSEGLFGEGALCLLVFLAVAKLSFSGAALITFLFVITRVIPKVTAINDARIRLTEYSSKLSELPRVMSADGLPTLTWGTARKDSFVDRIELRDVTFSYPGADRPALERVSLALPKGRSLAVVGGSGAGKSTLMRLILRLFDPQTGSVTVDGTPVRDLRREDWTRLVSVVGQDTFVFEDTLENNVKYGAPDCSPERFERALRDSSAWEFVQALPEGTRTQLGERGVRLSGGQRQRIAIARAFLRDAPILLLDEATSAMDAETELQIQGALERLSDDRTVLVIAHRFTTIRGADSIAVLDDGRLAESGTHEELLARGGLYRRFNDLQTLL